VDTLRHQVLAAVTWDVAPCGLVETDRCFIALMMEAVGTSETSVNFCQTTRRHIPEESHHTEEISLLSVF
jgi:hypothetical protein